jgi:hypothetical protein
MKISQKTLPVATVKNCRESEIGQRIKASLSDLFQNGYWFCRDCDAKCERVEGENGQPSHCDRCGSARIKWNPPLWSALVDGAVQDTELIHPREL